VEYGNIPVPATLNANLTGPAAFAGGNSSMTVPIDAPNGACALELRPATGATSGATFTLEVSLAGLQLDRAGTIAWELYLPVLLKQHS